MSKRWKNRPDGSNWGEFGEDDQYGRMNLVTAELRLRASCAKVALLEDEVAAAQRSLAGEKASLGSAREGAARLQADAVQAALQVGAWTPWVSNVHASSHG